MRYISRHFWSPLQRFALLCFLTATASTSALAIENVQTIKIASGDPLGIYFPTATALCNFINKGVMTSKLVCEARSTAGSIYNINGLRSGRFQLAIAQADAAIAAMNGSDFFEDTSPYDDLRIVQVLYPEIYTVLVRKDSNYSVFSDLKNKRVNEGPTGSGQYKATKTIVEALNWMPIDTASFLDYDPSDQMQALCDRNIDAFVMVTGHPAMQLDDAHLKCAVRWIGFSKQDIETIKQKLPYYKVPTIPDDLYRFKKPNTDTICIGALLLTDSSVPDAAILETVSVINQHFDKLQLVVPAFRSTNHEKLRPLSDTSLPPVHSAVFKYYDR